MTLHDTTRRYRIITGAWDHYDIPCPHSPDLILCDTPHVSSQLLTFCSRVVSIREPRYLSQAQRREAAELGEGIHVVPLPEGYDRAPLWLIEEVVRRYSHSGDLIWDPYARDHRTGLAALLCDRRYVGHVPDEETAREAVRRLEQVTGGLRLSMFGGGQ
jgi:hypothetical protein